MKMKIFLHHFHHFHLCTAERKVRFFVVLSFDRNEIFLFFFSFLLATTTENIPSKSTTSETKTKTNLRSESDITPTITMNPVTTAATTTTETKLFSPTIESSLGRSYDSGKTMFKRIFSSSDKVY